MLKSVSFVLLAAIVVSIVPESFGQKSRIESSKTNKKLIRPVAKSEKTTFDRVEVYSSGRSALVTWQMKVERSNIGFVLYRTDFEGTKRVNPEIIKGSALNFASEPSYGETYAFVDERSAPGAVYTIEAIGMDGKKTVAGPIAGTFVSELASVPTFEAARRRTKTKTTRGQVGSELSPEPELAAEIAAYKAEADLAKHLQVIAQPGVRIGVKNTGLHRITRSQLEAAGFDVNSDPADWQLYDKGVEQQIIVDAGGDYIEFFGVGIDTQESDTNMYYLIAGSSAGKRIGSSVAGPGITTVLSTTYDQTFSFKERTEYTNKIKNGGDLENFWGRLVLGGITQPITFSLSGVDPSVPEATITLKFQGFSNNFHTINATLNGNALAPINALGQAPFQVTRTIPTSYLVNGVNSLQLGTPAVNDSAFFDNLSIGFARNYQASQNRAEVFTYNLRKAVVDGFTLPDIRVFDTTRETELTQVVDILPIQSGGGYSVTLPADRPRRFSVVEDSALLQATSISLNNPAIVGGPSAGSDLLVLTHKAFMTQAQDWATYRQNQGTSVTVVDVEEIYDEFNYGVPSPGSLKAFLQHAYQDWTNAPEYVLLIGGATFDPRDYWGYGFSYFVPTRLVNTVEGETGTDEYLVDFDSDGLAEIAIGRIPGRTPQEISLVFDKVVNWETSLLTDPLARGALFASDIPDGYDFEGMSNQLRAELPDTMPATMVLRNSPDASTAQANLLAAMNAGKYITNYSGHGTSGAWAHPTFFANSVLPQVHNNDNESVYTMLTCLNGYFINPEPGFRSLAENLLHHNDGGAVAAWASTGLTTPDIQKIMALRFYDQLGQGNFTRLGDYVKDAKTVVPGGLDVKFTWVLLGDPMLRME